MRKGKIIKKKGKLLIESGGKTFSLKKINLGEEYIGKEGEFTTEGPYVVRLKVGDREFKAGEEKEASHEKESGIRSYLRETKIPSDTRSVLLSSLKIPDNFLLQLQKFARWEGEKEGEKAKFFKASRGEVEYQPLFPPPGSSKSLADKIKEIKERIEGIKEAFGRLGYKSVSFQARPLWRMTVGLGSPSVYETSITLHHIYGIPYIPASAIKGVLRTYYILEKFSGDEKRAEEDEEFVAIFGKGGDKGERGGVIFLDAYPVEIPRIKVDIVNPHYKEYYEGKKPPADYLEPTPITFLVVENTPFLFLLFSRKTDLEKVKGELKKALEEYGLGAKTSLGYGVMETLTE